MLIRFGYDITVSCAQDTPIICMMSVRDERRDDLRVQGAVETWPLVPTSVYRDLFGNTCRRAVAPAGQFRLRSDCTIEGSDQPDPVKFWLRETPVADLPEAPLILSLGLRLLQKSEVWTSLVTWKMGTKGAPTRRIWPPLTPDPARKTATPPRPWPLRLRQSRRPKTLEHPAAGCPKTYRSGCAPRPRQG